MKEARKLTTYPRGKQEQKTSRKLYNTNSNEKYINIRKNNDEEYVDLKRCKAENAED